MVTKKEYYVYGYYDEHGIPFYIGLGHKSRITDHLRDSIRNSRKTLFYNKLNKMIDNDVSFSYKKLRINLSLNEAKIAEEILIYLIGRRDLNKGSLCNLTDGGEGHKGYIKSEELKKRISKWSKDKTLSAEHKQLLRVANTGKKLSIETKNKISKAQKGISKPKSKESIINYIKAAKIKNESKEFRKKLQLVQIKIHGIPVIQLDMQNVIVQVWHNQIIAAKYVDGRGDRIIEVCKGLRAHHKKYKWKYYDK